MRAGEIVDTLEQRLRCEHRWRATVYRREWSAWSRLLSDRRRGHQRTHHRLRDQEHAGRLRPPDEAGRDLQRGAGRRHPRRGGRSGDLSRDSGAPGLMAHLASRHRTSTRVTLTVRPFELPQSEPTDASPGTPPSPTPLACSELPQV